MKQLDSGNHAKALNAATAIGDVRMPKQIQGRIAQVRSQRP